MSGKMKKIFKQTLILTVSVFVIGLLFGIYIDSLRVEEVKERMTEIDNLWNDVRLLQSYIQRFSNNMTSYCGFLLDENLKVGDRIYNEGVKVNEYEKSNRFDIASFTLEKERYALLDLQFWINSIDLKKLCNANYSTVIYFYSQYNKTPEQTFEDRVLWDLKQKCGPSIIYITFPSDFNISTIEVIKNIYKIERVPAVLINESVLLNSPVTMNDLEKYVKC
jgi:hypothetical protein